MFRNVYFKTFTVVDNSKLLHCFEISVGNTRCVVVPGIEVQFSFYKKKAGDFSFINSDELFCAKTKVATAKTIVDINDKVVVRRFNAFPKLGELGERTACGELYHTRDIRIVTDEICKLGFHKVINLAVGKTSA